MKQKFMLVAWLCAILFAQCQSATPESSSPIPEELSAKLPDSIVLSKRFFDKAGEHVLALIREHKISPDGKEAISLKVFQFVQNGTSWVQEWIIKDWIECQNLDIEGDFFFDLLSLSDLDSNGIFETTVAYATICAGGIEPKTTKVIMRQGEEKFAVRGESLVRIDEKVSYGGEFKPDESLDEKPIFKEFMVEKWKKAAGYTSTPESR